MSLITERFLLCDEYYCGEMFGVDMRHRTGKEHRDFAKSNGWTYRNGKDYCPKHSPPKENPDG